MKNDAADLEKIDEASRPMISPMRHWKLQPVVDGVQAVTIGYCATASNAWYTACRFEQRNDWASIPPRTW